MYLALVISNTTVLYTLCFNYKNCTALTATSSLISEVKQMGSWRNWVLVLVFLGFMVVGGVEGIGANWGTQATHPLPPDIVVKLLKDNGIQKVKLFDADADILKALRGSDLEVMVGIPNDMLYALANSVAAAEKWVEKNVSSHVSSNSVNIRYVL